MSGYVEVLANVSMPTAVQYIYENPSVDFKK